MHSKIGALFGVQYIIIIFAWFIAVHQSYNIYINIYIYWSKVLTDQQGLCRFFRKHKTVKNLKTATIKQLIIHLSNFLKCVYRKIHYVIFLSKNEKYPTQIRAFNFTTVDYPVYWTFKNGKQCWFASLWVLFVLRIISDNVFIKG